MFNKGDTVIINHSGEVGAIIGIDNSGANTVYSVLVGGKRFSFYESQISPFTENGSRNYYSAKDVNSLLTARLLLNPSINSLYSLNSAKINYIPYQFRPVLKIIKSQSPRILIADGVGVGKTIEAGLILKELEARFDIKSVLVICPRPLITEKKWQNEMMEKFGEKFYHINGETLKTCIQECYLDEEWPEEYQKCIIPYSLFDEAVVLGTSDGGKKKLNRKSLADLTPFPKFDLVIIDEAHHIKNPKTYAHQAVEMFCENAESVVMLTATPIQMGDENLYTLLSLLRPDIIHDYESFSNMGEPNPFINEAVRLIRGSESDWQEKALDALLKVGQTSFGSQVLVHNPVYKKCIEILKSETVTPEERVQLITDTESLHTFADIINRTRRRDIGEFTTRKPETLKVSFTEDQAHLYNELMRIQTNILMQLHGDRGIRFMMTTIMRQASSCIYGLKPFLEDILTRRFDELGWFNGDMGQDYSEMEESSLSTPQIVKEVSELLKYVEHISSDDEKVEKLIEVIKKKQTMLNNRVMVFSSFRHTLKYIHEKLMAEGIRVAVIHGGIKDEERVALRNRFKEDRGLPDAIDVLLFSEVGCEGLDYQFCDCLINYDLPWNPQAIEQRIGRIDRNGQKSPTISIVNIITEGTIDCDIYDRCLSRIGVFNSSIGDSEEILGEVTKEIYDIVQNYVLTPKEKEQRELQIADNAIRIMQEQRRLEDEKQAFFGLDLSSNVMEKQMRDATNVHLSVAAIEGLVRTYLEKRLSSTAPFIQGTGVEKSLKIGVDKRKILLEDFAAIGRQPNPIYKAWEQYLNDTKAYDKITFDGEYAAENRDVVFIMPTHPLVKQAIHYFNENPVECSLSIKSDDLPAGDYTFEVYEWQYKGIRPNNELRVITLNKIDSKVMLNAIYNANNNEGATLICDEGKLDDIHFAAWEQAKRDYLEEAKQTIRFKMKSLVSSQDGQIKTINMQLAKATNERIIKMKRAQIERLKIAFDEKQKVLSAEIDKCDIVAIKLVVGTLHVGK